MREKEKERERESEREREKERKREKEKKKESPSSRPPISYPASAGFIGISVLSKPQETQGTKPNSQAIAMVWLLLVINN